MSIGQLITEGVGSYGDVAHVITDGMDINAVVVTAPATILTEGFGTLSGRSPFVVMEGFGSTVTPTPTPTPTQVRGGGTSRRGRTLPQYYSRRFFGEEIQLPQEVEDNRIAQEVLAQAGGVLDDLQEDAKYDELLRTTDQLLRIVAVQIESRAIYNAIEQVRTEVLAKKDAEIREYITAGIDEENEVKELMEFL